jgi:hypothetical protein
MDVHLRGHDSQAVIPAQAGIQKPYMPLQTALKAELSTPLPLNLLYLPVGLSASLLPTPTRPGCSIPSSLPRSELARHLPDELRS